MVLGAVGKKCRDLSAVPLGGLFLSAPIGLCVVRECTSNSAPFVEIEVLFTITFPIYLGYTVNHR